MNSKLLCVFLTILLIVVVTWNLFVLNYLHIASKKQDVEKFENTCSMSVTSIKIGKVVSSFILVFAFLLLILFMRRLFM